MSPAERQRHLVREHAVGLMLTVIEGAPKVDSLLADCSIAFAGILASVQPGERKEVAKLLEMLWLSASTFGCVRGAGAMSNEAYRIGTADGLTRSALDHLATMMRDAATALEMDR